MADNIVLGSGDGLGDTLAADEIGGIKFQREKLVHGIDGTNDGDVAATNPLPVNAALRTDVMQDGNTQLTPKFAVINVAGSGDNTLIAAVVGKKIRVIGGLLIAAGAVSVRFESAAAGTALTGIMPLIANVGFQIPHIPVGNFETAVNTLLNLELSAAESVDGWLVYVEV